MTKDIFLLKLERALTGYLTKEALEKEYDYYVSCGKDAQHEIINNISSWLRCYIVDRDTNFDIYKKLTNEGFLLDDINNAVEIHYDDSYKLTNGCSKCMSKQCMIDNIIKYYNELNLKVSETIGYQHNCYVYKSNAAFKIVTFIRKQFTKKQLVNKLSFELLRYDRNIKQYKDYFLDSEFYQCSINGYMAIVEIGHITGIW